MWYTDGIMDETEKPPEKPVEWVGSSRKDIQDLPPRIRRQFGLALLKAQEGDRSPKAKPLSGFGGASVVEVVENFDTDTYRAIYGAYPLEAGGSHARRMGESL